MQAPGPAIEEVGVLSADRPEVFGRTEELPSDQAAITQGVIETSG